MIHLRIGTNGANDPSRSLCRGHNATSTENPPFVTCKDCLTKMEELEIEIKPVPYDYKWILDKATNKMITICPVINSPCKTNGCTPNVCYKRDTLDNSGPVTKPIVDAVMKEVAKDVQQPLCVRRGLVETTKKAEQLLEKHAKKHMIEWNQNAFKRRFKTLHKVIIEAINEALEDKTRNTLDVSSNVLDGSSASPCEK